MLLVNKKEKLIIFGGLTMNKFQKIALKIAKDDKRSMSNIFTEESLKRAARDWYLKFKGNKNIWTYERAVDFKNWNSINGAI